MLIKTKFITSNKLSFYRTTHTFKRYGEFGSLEEFKDFYLWAKRNNFKIYILGNGSNTLFVRKNVESLVLKNKLYQTINVISTDTVKVSSSTLIREVLKYCSNNSLSSFYYLASVPATVGGALAMNAGRGQKFKQTIYDFVESVDFYDFEDNCIKTLKKDLIIKGYRETIFTGIQSKLILSVVFKFEKIKLEENPILQRCNWSRQNQDYSAHNCGSVFKQADFSILEKIKGLHIGKASFSKKTNNWILNKSENYFSILSLIWIVKAIHYIKRKIAKIELILVD